MLSITFLDSQETECMCQEHGIALPESIGYWVIWDDDHTPMGPFARLSEAAAAVERLATKQGK